MDAKLEWQGDLLGVQPRIRLMRSFSERTHSYLGYVLRLQGTLAGEGCEFLVAGRLGVAPNQSSSAGMVTTRRTMG